MNYLATIDKSGRLVLPAQFRKNLGLKQGDGVMLTLKKGHIEISPVDVSIKKAQSRVKKYLGAEVDLVELLAQERKQELANEL
ncbi:MAG TPA: AbrB/MazE/SpoVT family DNA-binding domain-containing protein [Gammaproteobacteria bacterium]|jgi:AbrB family looped-hinge helix DNA binding protein|nr:AbrB/MazE/SpoVT family DNA-binding domain-containing protein [Gammaproteobacteria bacterium]